MRISPRAQRLSPFARSVLLASRARRRWTAPAARAGCRREFITRSLAHPELGQPLGRVLRTAARAEDLGVRSEDQLLEAAMALVAL